MTQKLYNYSRLCLHTMTTKPWSLEEAIDGYTKAGIPGITVWRNHLEPYGAKEAGKRLRESGLHVVSLCRGGFFPAAGAQARQDARDENKRIIDEAAEIGAPLVVLVCGAVPGIPLPDARQHITDGIAAVLPHAESAGVRLAIEALHPMYADDRSAVNTLEQANNMVTILASPWLGVCVDVYHVWWDPMLKSEISRAGQKIFAFHVSDWRTPTRHLLNDRGMMGEGCINIPLIRGWVEDAGFQGFIEVELFSDQFWAWDQSALVERIQQSYLTAV
ncbi:MAG: sugar phosphate isomerase/epimerase [Candidatus Hydrogenedentes bacterium]|jgi:sugar phosphate isomerase/epimerase|nr:sugar phosphate isomerase/epimerase [Candidatus Hydrogenedentota bacterium]